MVPLAASFSANSLVAEAEMVLVSMTIRPGRALVATPPSPNKTFSTSGVSGTQRKTTSQAFATSAGEAAAAAPSATNSSTAPRLRFCTVSR
jgi:hypothetical protein